MNLSNFRQHHYSSLLAILNEKLPLGLSSAHPARVTFSSFNISLGSIGSCVTNFRGEGLCFLLNWFCFALLWISMLLKDQDLFSAYCLSPSEFEVKSDKLSKIFRRETCPQHIRSRTILFPYNRHELLSHKFTLVSPDAPSAVFAAESSIFVSFDLIFQEDLTNASDFHSLLQMFLNGLWKFCLTCHAVCCAWCQDR